MKSIIPEQHWLNEPTLAELHAEIRTLRATRLAWGVAAVLGWLAFLVVCSLA